MLSLVKYLFLCLKHKPKTLFNNKKKIEKCINSIVNVKYFLMWCNRTQWSVWLKFDSFNLYIVIGVINSI